MRNSTDLIDRLHLALLCSERVLAALLDFVAKGCDGPCRLRPLVWDSLAAPDAQAYRHGDIEAALDLHFQDRGGLYHLDVLEELANQYLFFDGDRFAVNAHCLLDYMELIAQVDPVFLVGARIAALLQSGEMQISSLERFTQTQCALALPRLPAGKVWADNHIHLGGVSSTADALMAMADPSKTLQPDKWTQLPRRFHSVFAPWMKQPAHKLMHAYRQMVCATLSFHCRRPDAVRLRLADDLGALLHHGVVQTELRPISLVAMDECFKAAPDNLQQQIIAMLAAKWRRGETKAAFLLLAVLVCLDDRNPALPAYRRAPLLALVHLCHALRQTIIMQGVGLDAFMGFFSSAPRKVGGSVGAKMDWIIGAPSRRAEIKTTISDPRKDAIALIKQAQTLDHGRPDASSPVNRFHLCHHFSRSGQIKPGSRTPGYGELYRTKRQDITAQAEELAKGLRDSRAWQAEDGSGPRLNAVSLLRGFDVAGNENAYPIEVFAPSLRWLREHPIEEHETADSPQQCAPRRTLSIHAGEDFAHLLGGLRHIDETVKFCNLGAGDRLGHALALGLDPHHWAHRQGRVLIPMDRHLDNLVWLWHMASRLAPKVGLAAAQLGVLERKISFYADKLREPPCPSVEDRYRAWKLRRNCPDVVSQDNFDLPSARYRAWDYHHQPSLKTSQAHFLYQHYLRWRMENPIATLTINLTQDGKPETDRDYFGRDLLELLAAIQDDRMTEYDRRGIVLEACPSSNLHISRIDDMAQHPALRWHPPHSRLVEPGAEFNRFSLRNGKVRVCINTDDPGIFPTDIVTEHRLLAEAARRRFTLSQADCEIWKEALRQEGIEAFEQAHARVSFV